MTSLRSLLFLLGLGLSTPVAAILGLLVAPLPWRWRYRFFNVWSQFNLWWVEVTCGIRYRVHGREHLPAGSAIVLAKHQSAWETFAFRIIFPPQTWVLKRELLWIPFFGWGLALLRPIAIDRKSGRKALSQIVQQGRRRLADGLWVVVFPEGTRVPPGTRGRYQPGGAVLAERTGYPVVPVAHNAGHFWPRKGWLKRPGEVQVVIGPPIDPAGKKAGDILRAAETWIEDTMATLPAEAGARAPGASAPDHRPAPTETNRP